MGAGASSGAGVGVGVDGEEGPSKAEMQAALRAQFFEKQQEMVAAQRRQQQEMQELAMAQVSNELDQLCAGTAAVASRRPRIGALVLR